MDSSTFIEHARRSLASILDRKGCILYSSMKTLALGDIYILGLNPGGDIGLTIGQDLDSLPSKKDNAYLDERWKNGAGSWEPGKAPLQQRIIWLAGELGYPVREICASNLIFIQSPDKNGINYPADADICWPVHELLLNIVKPKMILAFGNSAVSPYSYLHNRFGGDQEDVPSGHGSWVCKGFKAEIAAQETFVAGIPHLSRYSPVGRDNVVAWLRGKIGR